MTGPELFAALDRMDAQAWSDQLARDVVMCFANNAPVYGRDACRSQAVSLFDRVNSVSHHIVEQWEHGQATFTEAAVSVVKSDGDDVTIPMVTIYRTNQHGLIADYRVYMDPEPLRE